MPMGTRLMLFSMYGLGSTPSQGSRMKTILLLSTGGTFNKTYNPLNGHLEVDPHATPLRRLLESWQAAYPIRTILGKDSLEMDASDRNTLLAAIQDAEEETIVVIHGTDTMDLSAARVAQAQVPKRIVFTGAMVPWSIDPVEATANLASAIGYARAVARPGVYLAMNGHILPYNRLVKDRAVGRFVPEG